MHSRNDNPTPIQFLEATHFSFFVFGLVLAPFCAYMLIRAVIEEIKDVLEDALMQSNYSLACAKI